MAESGDLVRRSLAPDTRDRFDRRVAEQAADLLEQLRSGRLDNADPAIGLELEGYVVDADGRLATIPGDTFEAAAVARELGRHNFEINTPAAVFDEGGIADQHRAVSECVAELEGVLAETGQRVVLDAMWTIPPAEGTLAYLCETAERDGVTIASNMTDNTRYHALDNHILKRTGGEIELELPGASVSVPTILVESLTSSIQPHLQVPNISEFLAYYNTAIRTLGPVLALTTNSPLLPADLYRVSDPDRLLEETAHELRIPVFEQSINAGQRPGKVRFPDELTAIEDVIEELVEDRVVAPFLREWVDADGDDAEFMDTFWELNHKHGTYWRWLRPVVGGDLIDAANDEESLRIEYRPLPAQPSAEDLVAVQCFVAGAIHGLVVADHPLRDLEWSDARESFYRAVQDGIDADLHWVSAAGSHTTDAELIYRELFEFARRGLRDRGVSEGTIDRYLAPLERRRRERTTPSVWKLERVAQGIADGRPLEGAIREMQTTYIDQSGTPFDEWF